PLQESQDEGQDGFEKRHYNTVAEESRSTRITHRHPPGAIARRASPGRAGQGYPPVNPAQEKIHMSDPQSVLPAVQQMPDTVTVSKETLKKVSNVLASGARLLRSLEREGNESDRLAGAARVGRLRTKLSPVVEMARAAVIEARALAGSS